MTRQTNPTRLAGLLPSRARSRLANSFLALNRGGHSQETIAWEARDPVAHEHQRRLILGRLSHHVDWLWPRFRSPRPNGPACGHAERLWPRHRGKRFEALLPKSLGFPSHHLGPPLRCPVGFHPLGLLPSLSGGEFPALPLRGWCLSSGSSSRRGILWRASSALCRSLKSLYSSIQLVSLSNQKCNNLFCWHREDRNTMDTLAKKIAVTGHRMPLAGKEWTQAQGALRH